MPASLSLLGAVIWATAPLLQLLCVYFLYRRKMLEQFKFFASFLVFITIKSGALFLSIRYSSPQAWTNFSVYWVGTAMADLFMIAVLYEVFCAAFKPFVGLQDLAKVVFKWAAGSIVFIGLMVFMTNPASTGPKYHWVTTMVFDFERIVCVMECALLMFLFIGSQHLGISTKNRVFGIALGFGFQAFFQLMLYSAALYSHISKLPMYKELVPLTFYISIVIWLSYLALPEPSRESLHIPVTSPLLRWNEVALALGHTGGKVAILNSEPFMPTVEKMVEQVMQKEMIIDRRQARVV
jgi:hypothetical protein